MAVMVGINPWSKRLLVESTGQLLISPDGSLCIQKSHSAHHLWHAEYQVNNKKPGGLLDLII